MNNERAGLKVLSSLYQNHELIDNNDYPLRIEDFPIPLYKQLYTAMFNLYCGGNTEFSGKDIAAFLYEEGTDKKFSADGGNSLLIEIADKENSTDFEGSYKELKKASLLKDLESEGINTNDIKGKSDDAYRALDVDDIFLNYEKKIIIFKTNIITS